MTELEAVQGLALAYCNVFKEFLQSGKLFLRSPPICGGHFAGRFYNKIAEMTADAIQMGFQQLSLEQKIQIQTKYFKLCIYDYKEYEWFSRAIEAVSPTC